MGKTPLSKAGLMALKKLAGMEDGKMPATRRAQEQCVRSLIARGFINPIGWVPTELGRDAIAKAEVRS